MTVSTTTSKASASANGTQHSFAYGFKIFADADLQVTVRAADGTETLKTLNTHYIVTNAGSSSGGNVLFKFNPGTSSDAHFSSTDQRPQSGETVVIKRELTLTQGTDYVANDPFPAESHEDALDRLTFISQQQQEELDRTIKASVPNTISGAEFALSATDRANKVMAFDGSGDLSVTQELGTFKGNWAASTDYVVRDIVKDSGTNNIFIVNTAHTSSGSLPLTTNTNSAKYDLIVDAATATTAQTAAASRASAASSATAAASSETNAAASAASAATALDNFDDRYLGSKTGASNPTVDNDGDALVAGALYFNATANEMRVYDGANWIAATSAGNVSLILYEYTATSGQTTFSGSDDNSATLSYTVDNLQVVMNGVVLDPADFTATNGTSVVLDSAATLGDQINIYAFKSFTTADMVSKTSGGTFSGAVGFSGGITGDVTIDDKIVHSGDTNTAIRFPTADTVTVETGGSEAFRIDSSQNVGIGTTPASGVRLDIRNDSTTNIADLRNSNSAGFGLYVAGGTGTSYYAFRAADKDNAALFTVRGDGNVGIGTTSPASLIHGMAGDLFLTANSTSADSGQAVYFQSTTSGWSTSSAHAAIFGKRTDGSNGYLRFDTRGSGTTAERMRIDSSGNVLIGKTGTAVAGANGAIIKPNGQYFSTTSGANTYHYYDDTNSRYAFYVLGNGGVANFSANNNNLSDETEKKNITAASSAWDNVKALSVKQFHYNFEDDSDPKKLGVIAQEVQVNHPHLVTSFEVDDSTTKLGVVEQQITWMAIKALQEAMAKIETLETKVAALEAV